MSSALSPEDIRRLNEERRASSLRKFMVPLFYAPLLPLIRVSFRHRPKLRDKLFAAGIACGLIHAGYVMVNDSSVM